MSQTGVSAAPQKGNSNSELNHTDYYEGLGYGTCTKTESPGDPYVLGSPPSGNHWTLLVLKAGSESSNDDWNTLVENPTPGPYVHPSGKNLSHVISCYKSGGSSGTTTTTSTLPTSTTQPGGSCDNYTPTQVAVNPVTVLAGNTVTITGVAFPGDTVSATLSPSSTLLGTAVAGPTGQFSITGTIPVGTSEGTYTITVSSPLCPTSSTITITVAGPVFSGCGANSSGRTLTQGGTVNWELHASSFSTSSPVTLRLTDNGMNTVLYSGPWPTNDTASTVIPATAPIGKYTMEQTGTKKNGKGSMSKTCPVWVTVATSNIAAISSQGGIGEGQNSPNRALVPFGALAVGGYALIRLSRRRAIVRTTGS